MVFGRRNEWLKIIIETIHSVHPAVVGTHQDQDSVNSVRIRHWKLITRITAS